MRTLSTTGKIFFLLLLFPFLLCCEDKSETPDEPENELHRKVNQRLYDYFSDYYLWNTSITSNSSIRGTLKPEEYFERLRHVPDDKWSTLYRDGKPMTRLGEELEMSFGYGLALGRFSNANSYFAIITHVYPNSPAEKAKLKRGDIIVQIYNENITDKNIYDLWDAPELGLTMGKIVKEGIGYDRQVTMKAAMMYCDPVNTTKIIETANCNIGYICYTDYHQASKQKLQEVFSEWKDKNVTEVVLDLRYNGGGESTTSLYLSSILAPASTLNGKTVFLRESWNAAYNAYCNEKKIDLNQYFMPDIPVNMNLKRVFILTSGFTASASEATISGLTPYMDVVTIGDTTYGKYCGAAVFDELDKSDKDLKPWGMTMVVYRFVNRDGFTDFKDGIPPAYRIEDNLFAPYSFGDIKDPQLAKAISLITQSDVPATASTKEERITPEHIRMLPAAHSFYSPVKREMITNFPSGK